MFSLIVATKGRVDELGALFASIAGQGEACEVIVVDQNGDGRLAPVLAGSPLPVTHLRLDRANANAARNLGLRRAAGGIVAFPDDDCTLPPGTLARVARGFAADPRLALLTGPAEAPGGGLGSGRWRAEGGPITLDNVWTSVIEFNLWLRREHALALGGFDERMGPGTRFGSAEGNDLVCRALAAGLRAEYDPDLRVVHPDKRLTPEAVERARRYALGLGFALRRHRVPPSVWARFLVRPAGGAALSLLRGDLLAARYYAATLRGRAEGLLAPPQPPPGPLAP